MGLMPTAFTIFCFPCLLNETGQFICQVWWKVDLPKPHMEGDYADCVIPKLKMTDFFPNCTLIEAQTKFRLGRSLCNRTSETENTLDTECFHSAIKQKHRYRCKIRKKSRWPFWRPPSHFPNKAVFVFWVVLASISSALTIILNFLTIFVFTKSQRLRNSKTIIYAANMAFIDLLIGFALLPLYILLTYDYNIQRYDGDAVLSQSVSHDMINWHAWIDLILLVASFTNLAFMSAERAIVVLKPFWHMTKATYRKVAGTVPVIWVYSISIFLIHRYAVHTIIGDLWLAFTFGFAAPTVVIAICYFLIIFWLKRMSMATGEDVRITDSQRNVENKVAMNLLVLKVVFLVCWIPYFVALFKWAYQPSAATANALRWLKLLSYFHCFLDPILYAFAKPNIREEIRAVFSGRVRSRSVVTTMTQLHKTSVVSPALSPCTPR